MKMSVFTNPLFAESVQKLMDLDLPVKCAYKLSKIHKTVVTESEKFDELRKTIIKKHAKRNDDGEIDVDAAGNVSIPNENLDELNAEIKDLLDIDFDVDSLSVSDLGNAQVTPKMLSVLGDLITE